MSMPSTDTHVPAPCLSPDAVHLGQPAMVAAIERGQLAVVRELLLAGADPNKRGSGYPPLVRAAFCRNLAILGEVLKGGADVNSTQGRASALK